MWKIKRKSGRRIWKSQGMLKMNGVKVEGARRRNEVGEVQCAIN